MTNTNKQSILRNFGDFLRKEVAVTELFKDLVLDPGMQQPPIRPATIRPQAAAASYRLRPEAPRGRLLYFPSKRPSGSLTRDTTAVLVQ